MPGIRSLTITLGVESSTITLDSMSWFSDSVVGFCVVEVVVVVEVVLVVEVVEVLVWKAARTQESPTCLKGELQEHLPNRFGIRKSQWLSAVHNRQCSLL